MMVGIVFTIAFLTLIITASHSILYTSTAPVFLWNAYLNQYQSIDQSIQQSIDQTFQQTVSINQLTHSINHQQRNITTLRLCEPAAHYEPNYTSTEEHWPKVVIPQKDDPSNNQSFNQSTYFWKFYEIQTLIDQGEIRIPLLRGYLSKGDRWLVDWFTGDDVNWLERLEADQSVHCLITYSDQSIRRSKLHVSAVGHTGQGGIDSNLWATCATDYYKIPISLTISIIDQSYHVNHFLNAQSVELPICQFTTPVYYAVAQLRALYSFNVDDVIDWISYHYALGVDHFFFHYRYKLTEDQTRKFAPFIAGGLLTIQRFPLAHNSRGVIEVNTDQNPLLLIFSLRIAHHATWVLALDHDEYLRVNTTLFPRECSNSLWCSSSLKEWLEDQKGYSVIQFDSINMVAEMPPKNKQLSEDAYRYSESANQLPMPIRRVWRRSQVKTGVVRHCKWLYHVPSIIGLTVHGGSGVRPTLKDYHRQFASIYHYHDYPIWEEDTRPKDEQEKQKRVDMFWTQEGVRDTYVSDVYEQLPWPADTDRRMLQQVKPYMGKHTPKYNTASD